MNWNPIKKLAVWLLFSILFVSQVYPLVWLLLYSFKTNKEIMAGGIISLPDSWQWSNYEAAYTAGNYVQYLLNSLVVVTATLLFTLLLSAMVSYAMTRFNWRWGNALMLLFMIGIMIPIQSTLLPLVVIFKNIGILNTYWSLILPYIAFAIPIAVFVLSGFFRSVPREIEESAAIDGASVYRTFFHIIIPIITPPIMTVTILTFIDVWNEYILASTFISKISLKTLPFGIYSFFSQYSTNHGAIGAYLVMGAIPVILVYFILADKITKGMVAGAIKG